MLNVKVLSVILVIYLFLLSAALLMSYINIPEQHFKDDGSYDRHTSACALGATIISSIFPTLGDDIMVEIGARFEKGSISKDSLRDMRYNKIGAEVGGLHGTMVFFMMLMLFIIIYLKQKNFIS